MLFNISDALKVKLHYQNMLIGQPVVEGSGYEISGLFVCHKGNSKRAVEIMQNVGFDETQHKIAVTDDNAKDFEVYLYYSDGSTIAVDELDANLTERGMDKIY